jgi:NAD(P)-dependent dehydrogenase (short-subunit alcohol dehydrogenase family)
MKHPESPVWLITGSSRGLGRALAEEALAHGNNVVASARTVAALAPLVAEYGDQILAVKHDVTDPAAADATVAAALAAFGRIDVLVNNAGYGFIGAFEEMTPAEFEGQIDANFWGVVYTTRAAVPVMRKQRTGRILQVTSIGGRFANAGLSGYHAAKFAVEGFSEALAQELAPLGVKVTIVEPGQFRTDWAGSSMAFAAEMPEYATSVGLIRQMLAARETGAAGGAPAGRGDPCKAATAILRIAEMPEPPLRIVLGTDGLFLLQNIYERDLRGLTQCEALSASTDYDDVTSVHDDPVLQMIAQSDGSRAKA